ncbi:hypothetical protein [Psychrobacillus lasiicapitis]|uniref:Uncharacterized protein n=1 Tax=Psychrobacillus lasiicapitis TaxID=1636719 RepID=A0A544TCG3_9BACI|nr:hypothetical protein [Psychrobacillus lasiicapitis]TQR15164.1 hypothetical protein FG382_06765 [Psychrobacillus lasiicapitis]GGA44828.1 hypothetical protein GCM10011384_38180 [Psychrobacillus lasiicapitis]
MKHIYERTAKYTKLGSLLTLVIYVALVFIFKDIMWKDFETHFMLGFSVCMLLGTSYFFQHAAEKLPDEKKTDSEYYSVDFPVNELNFQNDVSIIPQSYLVSHTGERLYKITPTENEPIKRKLTAFAIFKSGMFFPITYDVKTMDGKLVSHFTIKNKLKFMRMKVYDHTKSPISTVIMPLASLKNRAVIFDVHNEKMHEMKAKSTYGDIDVNSFEGKRLATYRFGMFPYATHPAFEAQAMNIHVSLANDLSHIEKLTFTALFYYWTANQ